ncbi:uncharacterized protein [Physcomitrium patens]|uniref:RING-type domain-containing protein n=1 Tax=Physcomitrium patens TaxID=3218 RepID=A0A2K1KK36_PHYPA|nr:RING-H2 finger protein ATL38-like [Physcomitrium patens]PNR54132.1 hypothetical protein PHYPA_007808 [Physcomitrium patens]|eukprot:XP_024375726.1 RING-H2 finger protein ATL38-like [Physcomitrella patens]
MLINIAIAIGVGSVLLLALCCFFYWGVKKLWYRTRITGQISGTAEEIPAENSTGLRKDVVLSFPIVKGRDLNFSNSLKSQCFRCWLKFEDEDVLRQLPHCEHVFHRHCIDPVLARQITCPVCGVFLVDKLKTREKSHDRRPNDQEIALRSIYSDGPSSPSNPVKAPSWVHVNRPVPLPNTGILSSRSYSSDRFEGENRSGESPLLKFIHGNHCEDIGLEQCIDISFTFGTDIPVEKRHPSTHDKSVDSFSFDTSNTDAFTFPGLSGSGRHSWDASPGASSRSSFTRSRGKESTLNDSGDATPGKRCLRSTSLKLQQCNSLMGTSSLKQLAMEEECGHLNLRDKSAPAAFSYHLPSGLQDQCCPDVLSGNTCSGHHPSRPLQASNDLLRGSSNRNTYSQQIEKSRSATWERL